MFALPEGARLLPVFGKMATVSKARVVRGHRAKNMDLPLRREELVYGSDGFSLIWPDHSNITIRFSELAAALCYEDGGLHLIGSDAVEIMVEPALWRDGVSICRKIRQADSSTAAYRPGRPSCQYHSYADIHSMATILGAFSQLSAKYQWSAFILVWLHLSICCYRVNNVLVCMGNELFA